MDIDEIRSLIKQEKAELRTAQTLTDMKYEKTRYDYMIQGLSRLEKTLKEREPGEAVRPLKEI